MAAALNAAILALKTELSVPEVADTNPFLVGRPLPDVSPWPTPWEIDDAEYHGDRRCESSSTLNAFCKSPLQYFRDRVMGDKPAFKYSPALSLGTAFHHKLLTPSLFFATVKTLDGMASSQVARAQIEADPHACWLEPGGMDRIFRMESCIRAARQRATGEVREIYDAVLTGAGSNEVAFRMYDEETGIGLKIKADCLLPGILVDLKTSRSPDSVGFMRSFRQYNYALQAALYHHVLMARSWSTHLRVIHIAVSNSDRPLVYMYETDPAVLELGWKNCRSALTNLRRLLELGDETAWCEEPPLSQTEAFKTAFTADCHSHEGV